MTIETGLDPVSALAIVGVLGVGAQWVAWRMQIPAIVLMLAAGIIAGPVSGILDPMRDLGTLMGPLISIAVAVILFEGGLTLNRQSLSGAATGVYRLVLIGAPVGWLLSTLALHYVAGLGWASATVFGGIMIVTGPTVIAPLLRQAKLAKRPAALLQWEAIVNDPIGALAAVLAFEYVMVVNMATSFEHAMVSLVMGCLLALCLGLAGGYGLSTSFRLSARMGARIHESPRLSNCYYSNFCWIKCGFTRQRSFGGDCHGHLDGKCGFAVLPRNPALQRTCDRVIGFGRVYSFGRVCRFISARRAGSMGGFVRGLCDTLCAPDNRLGIAFWL